MWPLPEPRPESSTLTGLDYIGKDYNAASMFIRSRVFFHVVGKPFLTGLVFPMLVALIAVSFADTNINWSLARERLASAPIWFPTLLATVLAATWCSMAGQALRPVWRRPMMGFLVRQPLSRWQWVAQLMPNVCVSLLPVAAIAWLIQPRANAVLHYTVLAGLAWPMVFGASYRGRPMAQVYVGGALVFGALLFGYLFSPYFLYVALVVMIVQLPLSLAPIPRQLVTVTAASSRSLSALSPIGALMRRDLRCLLRTEWKHLVNLSFLGLLTPAMMLAFRINGDVADRAALFIAVILFSIAASAVYDPLERLKSRLGKEVFRLRWPVTHIDRTVALILLVGLSVAPSGVLIGVFGSTMGFLNGVAFLLFCALTIVMTVSLFGAFLATTRATTGQFLIALVAHGAIVLLVPAWLYIVVALASIVAGSRLAADRLHRFAVTAEIAQ